MLRFGRGGLAGYHTVIWRLTVRPLEETSQGWWAVWRESAGPSDAAMRSSFQVQLAAWRGLDPQNCGWEA
eukprot:scaffold223055_cov12-Tisochrysis_lutea.AAC.1